MSKQKEEEQLGVDNLSSGRIDESAVTVSKKAVDFQDLKKILDESDFKKSGGASPPPSRPASDKRIQTGADSEEVGLLRSTIMTMKKQGIMMLKNSEILHDENMLLQRANKDLEDLVKKMEKQMVNMQDEQHRVRNDYFKRMEDNREHEGLMKSRIETLEKLKV